jgi:hypothetical protein
MVENASKAFLKRSAYYRRAQVPIEIRIRIGFKRRKGVSRDGQTANAQTTY